MKRKIMMLVLVLGAVSFFVGIELTKVSAITRRYPELKIPEELKNSNKLSQFQLELGYKNLTEAISAANLLSNRIEYQEEEYYTVLKKFKDEIGTIEQYLTKKRIISQQSPQNKIIMKEDLDIKKTNTEKLKKEVRNSTREHLYSGLEFISEKQYNFLRNKVAQATNSFLEQVDNINDKHIDLAHFVYLYEKHNWLDYLYDDNFSRYNRLMNRIYALNDKIINVYYAYLGTEFDQDAQILKTQLEVVLNNGKADWDYDIVNIRLATRAINDLNHILNNFFKDIGKKRPLNIRKFDFDTYEKYRINKDFEGLKQFVKQNSEKVRQLVQDTTEGKEAEYNLDYLPETRLFYSGDYPERQTVSKSALEHVRYISHINRTEHGYSLIDDEEYGFRSVEDKISYYNQQADKLLDNINKLKVTDYYKKDIVSLDKLRQALYLDNFNSKDALKNKVNANILEHLADRLKKSYDSLENSLKNIEIKQSEKDGVKHLGNNENSIEETTVFVTIQEDKGKKIKPSIFHTSDSKIHEQMFDSQINSDVKETVDTYSIYENADYITQKAQFAVEYFNNAYNKFRYAYGINEENRNKGEEFYNKGVSLRAELDKFLATPEQFGQSLKDVLNTMDRLESLTYSIEALLPYDAVQ